MSPDLAARALLTPGLTATQRVVLGILCLYAHQDGTHCQVGVATIKKHTDLPRRTVYNAMDALRDGGWYRDDDIPADRRFGDGERVMGQKVYSRTINVTLLSNILESNAAKERRERREKLRQERHSSDERSTQDRATRGAVCAGADSENCANDDAKLCHSGVQDCAIGDTIRTSFSKTVSTTLKATPHKRVGSSKLPTPAKGGELAAPARNAPRKKTRGAAPLESVWKSYSAAFFERYGHEPARTAKVNRALRKLVRDLGEEAEHAPAIAAFYVGHSKAFYASRSHDPRYLGEDAHALLTQWKTGHEVTALDAAQAEKTAAARNQYKRVTEMLRNRDE